MLRAALTDVRCLGSACAVMFRSTERADTAATLLRRLAPLLITNIGDDSNYEVRRTALLVVKEVRVRACILPVPALTRMHRRRRNTARSANPTWRRWWMPFSPACWI